MSLQQLDLFGNPVTPASPKKKQEVQEVKSVIVSLPDNLVVDTPVSIDTIVTIEKPKIKSNRGRKPKPKVDKNPHEPKPKRGRKSYAETYNNVDLVDIPSEEKLKEKLYYSISEVAGWFNVTTSQLRFWEKEFSILRPRKNRKGDRLFRPEDIQNLKIIHYLLRHRKFSIEGAKDYFKTNKHKTEIGLQLQESLSNIKSFLLELKANL